jgi:hypothetical protein
MASFTLAIDQSKGNETNAKTLEEMTEMTRICMSETRDFPPPQLPQISLAIWQGFHDDFVQDMGKLGWDYKVKMAKSIHGDDCFFMCCCVGTSQYYRDRPKVFDTVLAKHKPIFASCGVGISLATKQHISIESERTVNSTVVIGFELQGAAGAAAAPMMVVSPVVMGSAAPAGATMQRADGKVYPDVEGPAEKLIKLKGLLDSGIITQEEFDKKKTDLLEQM